MHKDLQEKVEKYIELGLADILDDVDCSSWSITERPKMMAELAEALGENVADALDIAIAQMAEMAGSYASGAPYPTPDNESAAEEHEQQGVYWLTCKARSGPWGCHWEGTTLEAGTGGDLTPGDDGYGEYDESEYLCPACGGADGIRIELEPLPQNLVKPASQMTDEQWLQYREIMTGAIDEEAERVLHRRLVHLALVLGKTVPMKVLVEHPTEYLMTEETTLTQLQEPGWKTLLKDPEAVSAVEGACKMHPRVREEEAALPSTPTDFLTWISELTTGCRPGDMDQLIFQANAQTSMPEDVRKRLPTLAAQLIQEGVTLPNAA